MSDQVEGFIRDSDIKFQCRILLHVLSVCQFPNELEQEFLQPIREIVKLENERLDKLK